MSVSVDTIALEELLRRAISPLNDQIKELADAVERQRLLIDAQRTQLDGLQRQHALAATPTNSTASFEMMDTIDLPRISLSAPPTEVLSSSLPTSTTRTKEYRSTLLPDVPFFKGIRSELPIWQSRMKNKLEGNADHYVSDRAQFLYACSRVDGTPAVLLSKLQDQDVHSLTSLHVWLESQYGDPNRKANAQAKLAVLKQGNEHFWNHYTKFRTLATEAELDNNAQIFSLKYTLNPALLKVMVGIPMPETLPAYANMVATYDTDLRAIDKNPYALPSSHHYKSRNMRRNSDVMDIDTIDKDHTGYAPFGSKERAHRVEHKLCFKCGSSKHISPDCKKEVLFSADKPKSRHVHAVSQARKSSRSRSRSPASSVSSVSASSRQPKDKSRN